ncbi:MAG TPA: kelch repeat-containing protein, partial [Vicinamibacterales bacterium]|nr:kelch repeat-containing protein [Vicinamibacterales bacterium]
MLEARTGHTATLLADGRVLIAGGIGVSGNTVSTAEQFDPETESFEPLVVEGAAARAFHSATLLTDGRVLIVGGASGHAAADRTEIWSIDERRAMPLSSWIVRASHEALLLADGRVRLAGGVGQGGGAIDVIEIVDPATGAVDIVSGTVVEAPVPIVVASSPSDRATGVSTAATIVMRVSPPVQSDTATSDTVHLTSPAGDVLAHVVPAEGGRLVFLRPTAPLEPDTDYTLTMQGVIDTRGTPVVVPTITFRTAPASEVPSSPVDEGMWGPDAVNGWRTNLPPSPWAARPPLVAEPGVTALSGHVLTLQGIPLAGVTLEIGGDSTTTDENGQFLLRLTTAGAGRHELEIDGSTANRGART